METIIAKAISGNKSAITQLYNKNKDKIYSIAFCILQDKEKAEKIVIEVFSNVWNLIKSKNIQSEDEFIFLCKNLCVNETKKILLKSDPKAFQPPKNKNFIIPTPKSAQNWKDAINEFSTLQKFIFIVHVLCNFTPEQIAKIVCVDTTTVTLAINSEKINLDKIWSYNETEKNLFEYASIHNFQSDDVSRILDSIDKYVEPFEKAALIKKIKITIIILVIAVSILAVYGLIILFDSKKDNSSSNNTSTQSKADIPEVNWVTSVEATDYAVIDIKDYGKISVALDGKTAPITVENFKKLANSGFYDGLTFHRIMEGFMMQGGDPEGNGTGGSDEEIKGEFLENGISNNISHVRGAISMARSSSMDSASSQFFIVHKDSLFLNKKYAAFGYVVDGIDVVDKVCTEAEPTDDNGTIPAKSQPIINSVKIYSVDEFKSFTNTTQKEESSSLDDSNNSDESTTSDDSSNNTESSDTISNWVTSVEATDYAVIDIKDYGKISVALDSKTAPITVENFKKLANSGFYDGLTFHRIMEGFMMQGGDPEGNGTGGSDEKIKGEFLENGISNNISHVRGAISMARAGYSYDSATSQFFIVHEDSLFLNKKYAAFGYVVDGMDVVDKICTEAEPIDDNGTIPADNQPIINSINLYSVDEFKAL